MKIEIYSTNNDSFEENGYEHEIAWILRCIISKIEEGATNGICKDHNGNKVGEWSL